jgi:hypothetical protein
LYGKPEVQRVGWTGRRGRANDLHDEPKSRPTSTRVGDLRKTCHLRIRPVASEAFWTPTLE